MLTVPLTDIFRVLSSMILVNNSKSSTFTQHSHACSNNSARSHLVYKTKKGGCGALEVRGGAPASSVIQKTLPSRENLQLAPLRKHIRGIEANVLICRKGQCCDILIFSFYSFRMFPSGVAIANQLPPSHPILCILCSCTNSLHVLFHCLHKSPIWSFSRKPAISNLTVLPLIY